MSELARTFYGQSALIALPLAAMVFFAVVFCIAIVRALRADADRMRELSNLPFDGESDHE